VNANAVVWIWLRCGEQDLMRWLEDEEAGCMVVPDKVRSLVNQADLRLDRLTSDSDQPG